MAKTKKPKAVKAKKVDYASKDALARYDFETQKESTILERNAADSKSEYLIHKERAKDAKAVWESDREALQKYIRERAEGRGKPPKPDLFATQVAKEVATEQTADQKAVAQAAKAAEDDTTWPPADLWRQFPISRLTTYGLTEKDVEKIEAGEVKKGIGIGPIKTMGDLSKFTEPIAGTTYARGYGDLKGIGQAGVDRLSNAETAFWAAWQGGVGERFAAEMGLVKPEPKKPAKKKKAKEPTDGNETGPGDRTEGDGSGHQSGDISPVDGADQPTQTDDAESRQAA